MKRAKPRAHKVARAVRSSRLDKFIGVFNPKAQLERLRARKALSLVENYKGGSKSRRGVARWNPRGGGPESDLNIELPVLRGRSRDLFRNHPIARGAVNEKIAIVVGAGHMVDPQINREALGLSLDEAQEWEGQAAQIFRAHARGNDIDVGRQVNFAEMEALVLKTVLLSGDMLVFERFKRRRGAMMSACFQLIEGDRLAAPDTKLDSVQESAGIRRDKDGEPVEYYVLDDHPGELRSSLSSKGKWFKAFAPDGQRRVHHLFFMHRPGQTRGEPFLSPVIEALKQLDRYSEAELFAAVVNSCFAVTTKTDEGEGLDLEEDIAGGSQQDGRPEISIAEPGSIVDLAVDESLESFSPDRPSSQFDPFFRAIVSQIAVALDTTEEVLMRSFKASYSASRGAVEMTYRFCQSYEAWLISKFNQPVYNAVIAEAIARGELSAPGFFSDPFRRAAWLGATWTAPARLSLNPLQEAKADEADLAMGVTDRYRVAAKRGLQLDNVMENRAKAKRNEERLGLAPPEPSSSGTPTNPDNATGDSDDETSTDSDDESEDNSD